MSLIEMSSQARFLLPHVLALSCATGFTFFVPVTTPACLVHTGLPLLVDIGIQVPSPVGSEEVELGRCHRGQEALY